MRRPITATLRSIAKDRRSLPIGLLGASLLWASWPTLCAIERRWAQDPRYSHGYLVPVFAVFLFWSRRQLPAPETSRPSWWGLALIVAGAALKLAGARYYLGWFDGVSLLPSLAGVCLLVGGWPALRRAWPAIGFLVFMIPLPYSVERALGQPLQHIAVVASTYALQTLGLPALAQGNLIAIHATRLNVAEACNGMGVLFMFFAFAVGTALVVERTLFEKIVLSLSAIPIALVANVCRITLTGVLIETMDRRVADTVYHDLSGWLMMPIALVSLALELKLFANLYVEVETKEMSPVDYVGASTPGLRDPSRGEKRRGEEREPTVAARERDRLG